MSIHWTWLIYFRLHMMVSMPRKAKILFVLASICLAVLGSAGLPIWWDYQETLVRQQTTAQDVSRVVVAQIDNSIHQAQTILGLIAETIQADDGLAHINESSHWKKLHALCISLTGCKSIAVLNPAGQIVALSNVPNTRVIDASDRMFFRAAKETKKLFIGPAIVSRIPGNPILFSIAIPVLDASGKLLAVLSAGMDTEHLTDFYGLMGFAVSPTVTVFKSNGDLVARNPDIAKYVGRNYASGPLFKEQLPKAASGIYLSHSVLDGKTRIASYQSIKELDLVVYAGIDLDTALHQWRKRTWRTGIASALALGFIFLAMYWGYRLLRRSLNLRERNIELNRISNADALTGIPNRRFFDTSLKNEWIRHKEEGRPLSLLMIDIDCFKPFNDKLGHQAGDHCIRQVATTLQTALLRDVDIVARYGGEEFAVILDANQGGAIAVAERMREAVQSLAIAHSESSVGPVVTISVGLADIPTSGARSALELVSLADKALYLAKHNGRNRVAVYSPGPVPPK